MSKSSSNVNIYGVAFCAGRAVPGGGAEALHEAIEQLKAPGGAVKDGYAVEAVAAALVAAAECHVTVLHCRVGQAQLRLNRQLHRSHDLPIFMALC